MTVEFEKQMEGYEKVMVEGLCSISDISVHTLFDSGASHSFISSSLVEGLHLDVSIISDPVVV